MDHQVTFFTANATGTRNDIAIGDSRGFEYKYHGSALTIGLVASEVGIVVNTRSILRSEGYHVIVGWFSLPIVVRKFQRGFGYFRKHSNLDRK